MMFQSLIPEPEIEFTFRDAKRLWSAVCHEEKVAEMEKRSLMESAKESTSEGKPKRQRKTPSIDKYVSLDNVGSKVESRFGLSRCAPVNQLLLSAIHKTLEVLDHMRVDDLVIVNRLLNGAQDIPQFRHDFKKNGTRHEVLVQVRKKCYNCILTLKEGDNLPKPFSKALTVMSLFLKYKTRCADIPTSKFFSFSSKIESLQNDILRAIWSLPKIHFRVLKGLQQIYDPEAKIFIKSFRRAVKRHLMECLFECFDEVDIPPNVQSTVDIIINRKFRRQIVVYSKKMLEEETEAGQDVNSQLKQVSLNLLQHSTIDEMPLSPSSELLERDDASESNDFDMSYNYGSSLGECNSYTNEAEGTGDSWLPHN